MAEKKLNGWVRVYTSTVPYRATMVKDILDGEGLEAILLNQNDNNFKFGFCDVYVPEIESEKAQQIINTQINFE
jgi:Putative prokaryotic signal transducing protein